jgi:twinkle protein
MQDKFKEVAENSRMPKLIPDTYSKEIREYLHRRGISSKTAKREMVFEYTVSRGGPVMGFPFYINKTLVNVKYFNIRWTPDSDQMKWWQMDRKHGAKSIFLGMQSIRFERDEEIEQNKTVIITEGEWDWLTWKECGYNNVLSVPQGAPNPKIKNFTTEFDYITDPYVTSFFHPDNVDQIIFSSDGDAPGEMLRKQLAMFLGRERCKYINYPVGYKDINEVFAGSTTKNLPALGKEGVDECYRNLSSFQVAGIIKPSDIRQDLQKFAEKGFKPGLGCGLFYIDRLFTLKPKHITFVTGVPGSGKSVFVRWYLGEFVRHNTTLDIKWALYTPENRPVAREYAKLAEVITGQSFEKGYKNSMSEEVRAKTLQFIEKHFFIISPDRMNFETWGGTVAHDKVNTLESLLKYLIYLKKTENIFGYVIDAWNKIEHEQPKYMTETSFISQQLDHLINFNDSYDVHGIVIVHPRKLDMVGINYKMPSLYDIKGSSAWKEKADIGILVHRYKNRMKNPGKRVPKDADMDDLYNIDEKAPTIIRTEKIRFEELGHEDKVKLMMDFDNGGRFFKYTEPAEAPPPPVEENPNKLNPSKKKEEEEIIPPPVTDNSELPF